MATKPTTAKVEKTTLSPEELAPGWLEVYLKDEASEAEVGTVEKPKPWVSSKGKVYVHSRSLLAWLNKNVDKKITKGDVQAAMRSLGLKVKPATFAGNGKGLGFYQGVPKGVSLKGLPVRSLPRKAAAKKS